MTDFQNQTTSTTFATLDPYKHVKYSLGMVLGVDDFDQEFAYLSNHDQWLARDTIGYGTMCGLKVSVETDDRGPRISVEPGTAISPRGQLIRVTPAQCAYLNDWLGAHREDVVRELGSPLADLISLYVVLCYRACPTDKVPIPGEPCRDETGSTVDSRLLDDFQLELRISAPDQTEEGAVRDFVAWLSQIEITDEPTSFVDTAEFLETLRNAAPLIEAAPVSPLDYMSGSPLDTLHINSEEACEYWRAAFRLWVTELRPRWRGYSRYVVKSGDHLATIAANFNTSENALVTVNNVSEAELRAGMVLKVPKMFCDGTPPDEECVLLAKLDIPLVDGTASDIDPVIIHEEDRPYVIHLRMLQEWLLCGSWLAFKSASASLGSPITGPGSGPTSSAAGGLETDLTRIVALSWSHGGNTTLDLIVDGTPRKGLIVAFGKNGPGDGGLVQVEQGSLDHETFQIFVELFETESGVDFWTYRRIQPDLILPVTPVIGINGLASQASSVAGPGAEAAALILSDAAFKYVQNKKLSILIKGEFVLDETGQRAIDAEFVRAELPTGDRPHDALLGSQGGRFESWAWVGLIVNINTATVAELDSLPEIGPTLAQRIINARPYTTVEELLKVSGIGPDTLVQLRPFVTV